MIHRSTSTTISEALRGARETRALEIGSNILLRAPALFRQQFSNRTALIVADSITLPIAGQQVVEAFRQSSSPCLRPFVYSVPRLHAEHAYVQQLEDVLKPSDAIPVAVGAGTINDLTKLAAHRAGRPYMCVATAASMDGYTAFGASITFKGSKQTFVCPAPAVVLADLDIIRAAPADMNASGYADLLAKVTAGADWILADALGVEPIAAEAWQIIHGGLRQLVANPDGIYSGDPEALSHLIEGLMLSGFAMQSARTSRAASGAEHQFSHLWDMQHHTHNGQAPSHGFKVGIATLAVTALYESFLAFPFEELDASACCARLSDKISRENTVRESFAEGDLRTVALEESRAKAIEPAALLAQLEKLKSIWPNLREKLCKQLLPFSEIKSMLHAAGAPSEPEQVGISRQRLRDSFFQASLIRRRFTILDVVVRAGLLETFLDHIFGSNGHWPLPPKRASVLMKGP